MYLKKNLLLLIFLLILYQGFCVVPSMKNVNLLNSTDTLKKITFSLRNSVNYNYKIIHYTPVLGLYIDNHNIYLGLEYSKILINPLIGDPIDKYIITPLGFNLGYRYLCNIKLTNFSCFIQCNLSLYKINYISTQLGPTLETNVNSIFLENTLTIGVNYSLNNKINFFSGFGLGSFDGLFFISNHIIPSGYIGIEYKF